jgi:hypothetical protein
MMVKFVVVFCVFLEGFEGNTFRSIESGFNNDEKPAKEEGSCKTGQDVVEKTPSPRVKHVACGNRSNASDAKRGGIISDLGTALVKEEAIVHNLESEVRWKGNYHDGDRFANTSAETTEDVEHQKLFISFRLTRSSHEHDIQ